MKTVKIKKGFIVQKVGDSLSIFDGEKSIMYTLNETGAFIFQKIKKGLGKDRVIRYLQRKYHVSEKQSRADYDEFVNDLRKAGIVSS